MNKNYQLHLIIEEKFGTNIINFIHNNFGLDDHAFVVFSKKKYKVIDQTNVTYISKSALFFKLNLIRKLMKHSSKIHIHFLEDSESIFISLLCTKYIKKMNWVIWGGDLYQIKNRLFFHYKKIFSQKCSSISYLIKKDYSTFKAMFGVDKKAYLVKYLFSNDLYNYVLDHRTKSNENSENVRVLLGNSATEANKHIDLLRLLSSKKDNVEIFCPLSYGDSKYAALVEEEGKKLFGNNFNAIRFFMPHKEYLDLLFTMDVGVFGYKRQQGLGNIISLLLMGKKVFLYEDTPIYEEYSELFNGQILPINKLTESDLLSFKTNKLVDLDILESFKVEKSIGLWTHVFEDM